MFSVSQHVLSHTSFRLEWTDRYSDWNQYGYRARNTFDDGARNLLKSNENKDVAMEYIIEAGKLLINLVKAFLELLVHIVQAFLVHICLHDYDDPCQSWIVVSRFMSLAVMAF